MERVEPSEAWTVVLGLDLDRLADSLMRSMVRRGRAEELPTEDMPRSSATDRMIALSQSLNGDIGIFNSGPGPIDNVRADVVVGFRDRVALVAVQGIRVGAGSTLLIGNETPNAQDHAPGLVGIRVSWHDEVGDHEEQFDIKVPRPRP